MTYETHITIEPVEHPLRYAQLQVAAEVWDFKVAKLFMTKDKLVTPSNKDTFLTGHTATLEDAELRCRGMVTLLQVNNFPVWRYKIEHILVDSKYQDDPLNLGVRNL